MKKKLMVFVSSTYTDLKEERQAAVSAILKSGHIPGGMELFTAGDYSQQEIIKQWIEQSDAFLLIIGGRYGSLLPSKDKSYTHWEYDYAGEIKKPRLVLILKDDAIQRKIEKIGYKDAMEQDNLQEYKNFVSMIKENKLIFPIEDSKDIEIGIRDFLKEIEQDPKLMGWVSAIYVSNLSLPHRSQMLQVQEQVYRNQRVEVDNIQFTNCVFKNCIMVYKGIGLIGFDNCDFLEGTHWSFEEYSENTMTFLNLLYHNFGEVGRLTVEGTFKNIKDNNIYKSKFKT